MRSATFPTARDPFRRGELALCIGPIQLDPDWPQPGSRENHSTLVGEEIDQLRMVRDQNSLSTGFFDSVAKIQEPRLYFCKRQEVIRFVEKYGRIRTDHAI